MCVNTTLQMAIGDLGESKVFHAINLLRTQYPDHRIYPTLVHCSNPPYDIGIDIDGHYYRGQVKTTMTVTPEGRMVFDTSRFVRDSDGKQHRVPYTKDDIAFFLLYCGYEGEEWLGIGLLEECPMSTTVCKYGKLFKDSRRAVDMDFDKRIRELIEKQTITPIPQYTETQYEESEKDESYVSVFKKPDSYSELYRLLAEYDFRLDVLSDTIRVSVPTIQQWITEYSH